jgi:hypothetical protein
MASIVNYLGELRSTKTTASQSRLVIIRLLQFLIIFLPSFF